MYDGWLILYISLGVFCLLLMEALVGYTLAGICIHSFVQD